MPQICGAKHLRVIAAEAPPCALFADVENSRRWSEAQHQRYDEQHVWIDARNKAIARGRCDACGSDGKPPKAALEALGAFPRKSGEQLAWALRKQRLHILYGLRVVHREPPAYDIGYDSCAHHADNLLVLCVPCRDRR